MFTHREKDKAFIEIINWWLEDPTKRKIKTFPEELHQKITDEEFKFHIKRARRFPNESFESAFIRYKERLESLIRDEERHEMDKRRVKTEEGLYKLSKVTVKTQGLILFGQAVVAIAMILSTYLSLYIASPKIFNTPFECPETFTASFVEVTLVHSGELPTLVAYGIAGDNILVKRGVEMVSRSFDNNTYLNDGYTPNSAETRMNLLPKSTLMERFGVAINMYELNTASFSIFYGYNRWVLDAIPFFKEEQSIEVAKCIYNRDEFGTFRLKQ